MNAATRFFSEVPNGMRRIVFDFLHGNEGNISEIREFLYNKSEILRLIKEEGPGSFKILEILYFDSPPSLLADQMVYYSLSGQALRDRLKEVITHISSLISDLEKNGFVEARTYAFECSSRKTRGTERDVLLVH